MEKREKLEPNSKLSHVEKILLVLWNWNSINYNAKYETILISKRFVHKRRWHLEFELSAFAFDFKLSKAWNFKTNKRKSRWFKLITKTIFRANAADFLQICANLQKSWSNMLSNVGLIMEYVDLPHIHLAVKKWPLSFTFCQKIEDDMNSRNPFYKHGMGMCRTKHQAAFRNRILHA